MYHIYMHSTIILNMNLFFFIQFACCSFHKFILNTGRFMCACVCVMLLCMHYFFGKNLLFFFLDLLLLILVSYVFCFIRFSSCFFFFSLNSLIFWKMNSYAYWLWYMIQCICLCMCKFGVFFFNDCYCDSLHHSKAI